MVETQIELDKNGYYALYLLIGEENTIAEENILRIPLNIGVDPDAIPVWHIVLAILGIMAGLMIAVTVGVIMFSPILPLPIRQWTQKISREDVSLNHTQYIEIQK